MPIVSNYWIPIWRESQGPRRWSGRPNPSGDVAAFTRQLNRTPRLIYSTNARRWLNRETIAR